MNHRSEGARPPRRLVLRTVPLAAACLVLLTGMQTLAADDDPKLESSLQRLSYMIGLQIGQSLRQQGLGEVDVAALAGCAVMTGVGAALNTARCTRAPVWPSLAIGESCVRHEAVLRTTAQPSPRAHRSLAGRPAGDDAELRPAR